MQCAFLVIIPLLIFQNVLTKEIPNVNKDTNALLRTDRHDYGVDVLVNGFKIAEYKEERSIKDVWNNIKNSVKNAWNALKNLVQSTKEKLENWARNVKLQAIAIAKAFQERVQELKAKIQDIIEKLASNEIIKKCFQDEKEKINKILTHLVTDVTTCISEKITRLEPLEDNKALDNIVNDTDFMERVDKRLNTCQSRDSTEECLQEVREEIFKEMESKEDVVLNNRLTSRGLADDILDTVITCSTDGLIQLSSVLVNEIVNIMNCITQAPPSK